MGKCDCVGVFVIVGGYGDWGLVEACVVGDMRLGGGRCDCGVVDATVGW